VFLKHPVFFLHAVIKIFFWLAKKYDRTSDSSKRLKKIYFRLFFVHERKNIVTALMWIHASIFSQSNDCFLFFRLTNLILKNKVIVSKNKYLF
jgi:hypothetical protein